MSTFHEFLWCRAAERGNVRALQRALETTPNAFREYVNSSGGSPLKLAVKNYQLAAAQFLLDHGADVNAGQSSGSTALLEAAQKCQSEFIPVLLAAGANVHAISTSGFTPLVLTATAWRHSGPYRCSELLLAAGARVDDAGPGRQTPLFYVIRRGRRDIVKLFLRAGAREIATADLPARNPVDGTSTFKMLDAIQAAGGWAEYVAKHRRILAGLVSKLSPTKSESPRPIPLDAASHVVAFMCPPGGY